MKVGACQLPHIVDDPSQSFGLVLETCETADSQGIQLVCFPECYLQGYSLEKYHVSNVALVIDSHRFNNYLQHLSSLSVTLVLGVLEKAAGGYFNSAVVIKSGYVIGVYRKQRLLKSEAELFGCGQTETVFELEGMKIGVCICNDLNDQNLVDGYAKHGVKILVCPSNNYMGRESAEKWKDEHTRIRSERAKKAGLWLLSSDVTKQDADNISYGPTSLIDPQGEVTVEVPLFESGMCVYDITHD